MSWFTELTGVEERDHEHVRRSIVVEGPVMRSEANGRELRHGTLETPSLGELRERASQAARSGPIGVREIRADVRDLHRDAANSGAMFQVASQFNLLEMVGPSVTPEHGIGRYESDPTQGPACAIACGAGTIFRNYFAPVGGRTGQTRDNQIDCIADLGAALGNAEDRLWRMQNGYLFASAEGLEEIGARFRASDEDEIDRLRSLLRIGLQSQTEVTIGGGHTVSQAYCSALPVAYAGHGADLWEDFARLVLEAAYDATFCAARANAETTGNRDLFLTFLGGGAFGNRMPWIESAIDRAVRLHEDSGLRVYIVRR